MKDKITKYKNDSIFWLAHSPFLYYLFSQSKWLLITHIHNIANRYIMNNKQNNIRYKKLCASIYEEARDDKFTIEQ